jgi:hypothetical protein
MSEVTPAREVAARWCYAELRSSRFGCSYMRQGLVSDELAQKANNGIPFESLNAAEAECLRSALERHDDRGPVFYKKLLEFSDYVREKWDYSQLCKVILVPYYGCPLFADFERNPSGAVKDELEKIPKGNFQQVEPVIIVPCDGKQMLLEGTLRSLWFARDRNDSSVLEVWVPG